MKKRGLVIGLLMMLAVITSGFTYAFWAGSITVVGPDTAVGSINIGEGGEVSTTVAVNDVSNSLVNLVPVGHEADNSLLFETKDDVSQIVLSFSVNWSSVDLGAVGALGTLTASTTEVRTKYGDPVVTQVWAQGGEGFETLYGNMFTVTVAYQGDSQAITAGTLKTVTVTVTFTNEPASQAIYNQVANGLLEIVLSFAVVPAA